MEGRVIGNGQTSIVGRSLLPSVQRAWRSILPEFSLVKIDSHERKQGYWTSKKTGEGGWDDISSPCLSEQNNHSTEVAWHGASTLEMIWVEDKYSGEMTWYRAGLDSFLFTSLLLGIRVLGGRHFSAAFPGVDSFSNMGRAAPVQHFYNFMDKVPLPRVH